MSASEKICIIGWGAIGKRVADLLRERKSPTEIVAVAVRDLACPRPDLPEGAKVIAAPDSLATCGATLAVEVAGRGSVLPYGRAALSAGMDFAVSSTSAFVEEAALSELVRLAERNSCQILVPPGALGGIDALAAASRLGLTKVEHRIVKPARAWAGTKAEDLCDLHNLTQACPFFVGSPREAADGFPKNANVAVISSLAGIGMDKTRIALVADPQASMNRHEIHAEGEFGLLDITIQNRPLASNPKSSEMTALNLVRLIESRRAPLVL
ncbi:aspartate dehydrogenase [Labrenzia sp. 011]|uniref:aspartate dehydrogenase n=1 Tax=Labrenzia sp. 011 TaxID=2171494 RepID=UPI000D511D5F|nr:aspartate dehydrogenase [Labrenzia sp. 011]PVB59891.1 aspartate dehydrogenase [Labrenzia sp. 011]